MLKSLAYLSAESAGSTLPGSLGLLKVPAEAAPAVAWPAGTESGDTTLGAAGVLSAIAFACDAPATAAPVEEVAIICAGAAMLVIAADATGDASDDVEAGSGVWLSANCVDCDPDRPSSGAGSILVPLRIASKCK